MKLEPGVIKWHKVWGTGYAQIHSILCNTTLYYFFISACFDGKLSPSGVFYKIIKLNKTECTYNSKLRGIRESVLLWKSNKYYILVCVCVCHSSWSEHLCACMLPYLPNMERVCAILCLRLWPLWLHHIFSTLSQKWEHFRKKLLIIKFVFWFSLQLLSKTFLILRRIQQDIVINAETSLCKVPVILFGF
jgi:hypothetical protein